MRTMKQPKNTVAFSTFCAQLGTPMHNIRNSWCAYSPERRRAVFTVWADELVNGRYVFWPTAGAPYQTRHGALELRRVIREVMDTGHEALGVLCYAQEPVERIRVRKRFIEDAVLVLRFVEEAEGLIAYVQGEAKTADALGGPVASVSPVKSVIDDLNAPPPGFDSPEHVQRQTQGYRRDERVREYVIARAREKCEHCGKVEFMTDGGKPYLETHHIISLTKQGPDTVRNVIALCASHHREAHYGQGAEQLEQEFLLKLAFY